MNFLTPENIFNFIYILFACTIMFGSWLLIWKQRALKTIPFELDIAMDELNKASRCISDAKITITQLEQQVSTKLHK